MSPTTIESRRRAPSRPTTPATGPPIVLLHGLTATRRYVVMGSRAARARRASRHRLRRARPRRVRCRAGARTPTATTRWPRPAAVLDDLGIGRAVLAGASMGAHTLPRLALDTPERVAAAVVRDAGVRPVGDLRLRRAGTRSPRGCAAGGIEGFVAAYGLDPQSRRRGATRCARCCASGWRSTPTSTRSPTRCRRPALAPVRVAGRPGRIGVPAVVVASRDEADPGHPLASASVRGGDPGGARCAVEEQGSRRSRGRAASSPSSSPISRVPSGPLRSVPSRGFPNVARGSSERRE